MKVEVLFKGGIIFKVQKWGRVISIFFSHEPQYHKSSDSAESILFNISSSGVMRGHNWVKHFFICFNGEVFENLLKKPLSQNSSNLLVK
jgi:hypothetical protein